MSILNQDFTVGPGQVFTLRVGVTNLDGQQVGPLVIPVMNTPGPVVDHSRELGACDDRTLRRSPTPVPIAR